MPSDDLILNVRQITQYPQKTQVGAQDSVVIQSGGLGGPYGSVAATDFVATALSVFGARPMSVANLIAAQLTAQALSAQGATISQATISSLCAVAAEITSPTSGGLPLATMQYVDCSVAALASIVSRIATTPLTEAVAVTALNEFAPLSHTPVADSVTLYVNGRAFFSVGNAAAFTVSGNQITWTSTVFSVTTGDDAVAEYSYLSCGVPTSPPPSGPVTMFTEKLTITALNTLPPLAHTPTGSFTQLVVQGATYLAPFDFIVSGNQITWTSTVISIAPGDYVLAVYLGT